MDEQDLLGLIAEGDESVVAIFIDRYSGLIWSLASSFYNEQDQIEDAVQDVFVHLWQKADQFQPEVASEKTFVAIVARRRLIDRSRAKKVPKLSRCELDHLPERRVRRDDPDINEQAKRTMDIIKQLPLPQRRIMMLVIFHDMTHIKVAERLDLPLGTVKTKYRLGVSKVRKQVKLLEDSESKNLNITLAK